MVYRKTSRVKFVALLVSAATLVPAVGELSHRSTAFAQQSFGDNPSSFPVPATLPEGASLKVDGATSMRVTNEELSNRFEQQYPNVNVQLDASNTTEAIQALLAGEVDLVATGRPLTDEERAQGLVEVPLEREKIALLLGPDNPYEGNISFDQFARIFRGEITNWSELGGPDLPIRMVDRPEFSDTRRALSTYEVFKDEPFETGATADPVATDETDAVVSALGNDGVGYSVYSQVRDRDDVRIEPMHQTLPDDPRYPYSQHRAFVYREGAAPAALAFLGLAQTPEAAAPTTTPAPEEPPVVEPAPETTAQAPQTETTTQQRGGFPWWLLLLPLLLLPFLFMRGKKAPVAAPVPAPVPVPPPPPRIDPRLVLTPRNCKDAYAYWEIPGDRLDEARRLRGDHPLKLRLYDVSGRARDADLPDAVAEFDCVNNEPDLHLPIAVDDRDYQAEIGYLNSDDRWIPLAKSEPVHVPACPQPAVVTPAVVGAAAAVPAAVVGATSLVGSKPLAEPRMILTPRNCRDAYAYWEVADSQLAALKREGGVKLMVRLYDVTNRPPAAPLPAHTEQFEITGLDPDLHIPIQQDNHDYVAELGYLTADDRWLPITKSPIVRVPACESEVVQATSFPSAVVGAGTLAAGTTALRATAIDPGERVTSLPTIGVVQADDLVPTSRIVLTPRTENKGYAYWETTDAAKALLREQGGRDLQLRIYDATDIDLDYQSAHSVVTYDVAETDCDRFVPLPDPNRDYVAEIGYPAADGHWLMLARSLPVRSNRILGKPSEGSSIVAPATPATLAAQLADTTPASNRCAVQTVKVHSRDHAFRLDLDQMRHLQDAVATNYYLTAGRYLLRLRDGVFNYDSDDTHPGEPFVLLWIYGGRVINRKSGVPVNATWSTLNGYADVLILDVQEPATVCGFFMDTYPDDNVGEVTLSVIKL